MVSGAEFSSSPLKGFRMRFDAAPFLLLSRLKHDDAGQRHGSPERDGARTQPVN